MMSGKILIVFLLVVVVDVSLAAADILVGTFFGHSVGRFDEVTGDHLGDFISAGSGGLVNPTSAIFGPDGNFFVSSGGTNQVLKYNHLGEFERVLVNDGRPSFPQDVAFGADGSLLVASPNTGNVLRYDRESGAFLGEFVSNGQGGLATPVDLLFHTDGFLYVSDFSRHQVLRYDGASGDFDRVFVTPQSGGLRNPEYMNFGPDGLLYLGSNSNDNVLRFNSNGDFVDEFVNSNGNSLDFAREPEFGPDGLLYVSSFNSDQILRFDPSSGSLIDSFINVDGPTFQVFRPANVPEPNTTLFAITALAALLVFRKRTPSGMA